LPFWCIAAGISNVAIDQIEPAARRRKNGDKNPISELFDSFLIADDALCISAKGCFDRIS